MFFFNGQFNALSDETKVSIQDAAIKTGIIYAVVMMAALLGLEVATAVVYGSSPSFLKDWFFLAITAGIVGYGYDRERLVLKHAGEEWRNSERNKTFD